MNTWLKPRSKAAHKGLFGHVLVIGGDYGMPGAVKISASGALKMGAGLVTVITHIEHVSSVVNNQPELLCYGLRKFQALLLKQQLANASMIILGPGLGQSAWAKYVFNKTIEFINTHKTPCLLDADGLNWLVKTKKRIESPCIFTPHPGEAARLLGCSTQEIQSDRIQAAHMLQEKLGGIIVLKGDESLVCTAEKDVSICRAGNPAMASGGMGDLLGGIISGLVAQGLTLWQAAQMGVLLHAKAGDSALEKQGGPSVLASDLILELKPLLSALKQL
ncbi:MAG: NAD(P)H-hydrate dehydratase [Gammaproteobacteria bacterium]|nr:NAD(P)H-hydrate dehydratase [Gammaproteobacteria bacterium]MCH9764151.1 NAD(P)H-hydrate dehydratase [Gammaproteobacteria bacterium]